MSIESTLDDVTLSIWHQVENTADLCVKCNICTSHCPVSNVTPLFPGPKFVGPQAQRFRNPHEISVDDSLDYCSGCGVCTMVQGYGVVLIRGTPGGRQRASGSSFDRLPLRSKYSFSAQGSMGGSPPTEARLMFCRMELGAQFPERSTLPSAVRGAGPVGA